MNPTRARLQRTPPERSGPIRNAITGNSSGARNGSAPKAAPDAEAPGAGLNGAAAAANGALRGALECGVRTAYAVIDDYMRRGYEAARANQNPSDNRGDMSQNKSSFGNNNPWGSMGPMMDVWSSAFRMWTEAWFTMMPGMRGQWGQWPGAACASVVPVNVTVASKRPVSVTLITHSNADPARLTLGPFQPALDGVRLSYSDCIFHVRAAIADTVAIGEYRAPLSAADGSIAGDLKLMVYDFPGKA